MARFNTTSGTRLKTTNKAGGEAYVQSPKFQLASILLTSFVQDQFYRGTTETLEELKVLLDKVEPKFSAKAAIFARNEYGMRSISHAVAGELVKRVKGEPWMKDFIQKVVRRPDDITEILSYYITNYKKPIPNSLKKGLGAALSEFDEYSLGKYRGEKKDISLIDAVNLVHPKSTEALTKLMNDELRSKTWETGLTQAGQTAESDEDKATKKEQVWKELISENKLGYFALLRNLRNIIEQAPDVVDLALDQLMDPERIKKSLVLPFRFYTAAEEISKLQNTHAKKVIMALAEAVDIAVDNVPSLPGKTLIALDDSGSMTGMGWGVGIDSKAPIKIGSLFAAVMYKSFEDAHIMMFSDHARHLTLNPSDSTLTLANKMMDQIHGGGTDFHLPFSESKEKFDRVVILSDMQGWEGGGWVSSRPGPALEEYKGRTGADPVIYSFDLQGYGSLQFPERNVYCLAGFSEKVFDVMKMLESDREALIRNIEETKL